MKINLIYPNSPEVDDSLYFRSRFIDLLVFCLARLAGIDSYERGKKAFLVPPLNLMLLAAYAPREVDVQIIDERVSRIDYEDKVDLVGITCITSNAPRAYEIADGFRSRDVKVILGGIHPTVLPEEASNHADSVVIGEADGIFDLLLDDTMHGRLRKFYKRESFHSLKGLPFLRRDLVDDKYYVTRNLIQTSRGCPHHCRFCCASIVAGPKYRFRPLGEVLKEIEQIDTKFIGFVDDNINGSPSYAKELFRQLRSFNLYWYGNSTVELADSAETLSLAAKSGCKILLIGFESFSKNALSNVNKSFNDSAHYISLIKRFHDNGIGVIGCFILGLDGEAPDQFDRIVHFANKAGLDGVQASILVPYPGTAVYREMDENNRILTKNWSYYDTTRPSVVFSPLQLTIEELQQGYQKIYQELYSFSSISKRLWKSKSFPAFFLPYNIRKRRKFAALRVV